MWRSFEIDAAIAVQMFDLAELAVSIRRPAMVSGRRPQAPDLVDRGSTSRRRLGALDDEMVVEELLVLVMLVEVLRRQDGRYDRHLRVQLNAHQSADHGFGDELMPVDPAIDHEPGGNDGGIAPAFGEQQRVQRNFQRSGHLEKVDVRLTEPVLGDFGGERHPAAIDDLLVPAGLHEGDPPRVSIFSSGLVLALIHRCSSTQETRIRAIRASKDYPPCVRQIFPFSFIRTVTVGFGIAPNLLTPPIARRALAGFGDCSPLPPVGTFTPPREHGRTEIRPTRLTHLSQSNATIFCQLGGTIDQEVLHLWNWSWPSNIQVRISKITPPTVTATPTMSSVPTGSPFRKTR